ncbi:Choline-sulfatase [Roseibium album]|uniref:Choline-sulfatase n=2 Tax=Roseibium album TaxID=311410 RepID=A0A0M6Z5S7_9HYPH|nr:Choline-sulfatase [Roseibium album]CTQ69522.1 Choline-sulfatase [Roseibium album]CTQ71581.1 Choline-sulfatase [Roseibium album]
MKMSPNILFLQVDQLTASALRAYGDRICHSPALDRLAENGVVFENAYCNFPLCAPSRFSMATGQLCSAVGAYDNAAEFSAEIPTYAHYLRVAGYQTALSGKMHFIGPDQFHGFEKRLTADLYPADFAWVPNWANEGKRDTNDDRAVRIAGICERSVQIDYDEEVTFRAVQHIYDMARSSDERPFFLQVSYTHPHEPYLCRKEFWDLYEGKEIPMPKVSALSEQAHDPHSVRLLKDFGMLGIRFKDEDVSRAIRAYYGSISYLDSLISRVLDALSATGAAENTVVVFTSDHGEMLGERGMWFKKHFFEKALRVPLIVKAPWIAAQRVSELTSLVDLLPTFGSLAGSPAPVEPLEGIDLMDLLDKGNPPPQRPVYAEYLAEATPAPIFMIRRQNHKFISSSHDGIMLFDLAADPDELTNLATSEFHQPLVEAFCEEVRIKWNETELVDAILLSQKRRALVRDAMNTGQKHLWNHGEKETDSVLWYRGVQGYNEWAFDYI